MIIEISHYSWHLKGRIIYYYIGRFYRDMIEIFHLKFIQIWSRSLASKFVLGMCILILFQNDYAPL